MIASFWSLFWSVFPFVAAPPALVWFGRYVLRRSPESFAEDFIPENADVAAALAALPKMPGQKC